MIYGCNCHIPTAYFVCLFSTFSMVGQARPHAQCFVLDHILHDVAIFSAGLIFLCVPAVIFEVLFLLEQMIQESYISSPDFHFV